jgi:hypothetical protein
MVRIVLPLLAASLVAIPPVLARNAMPPPKVSSEPLVPKSSCTDTIHLARRAAGMPSANRSTGSASEPLLLAAVDRRIENCRVLVMANDHSDIRPEPEFSSGEPRLRPAR